MLRTHVRSAAVLVLAALATPALTAQNLGSWFVDGQRGQDIATNGRTRATPWKTIAYAQTQIPPVDPRTQSRNWQTLYVLGDQTYSPSTNGETLPIVPVYNLFLEGTDTSAVPPIIKIGTGGTGLRFSHQVGYSRNPSTIRRLIFDGGDYGIEIGGSPTQRHRPRVQDCLFRNQAKAGARIMAGASGTDPRFFQNTFQNGAGGIEIDGGAAAGLVVPDIEECFFHDLSGSAIHIENTNSGNGTLATLIRSSQFWNCRNAIDLMPLRATAGTTRVRLSRSTFHSTRNPALQCPGIFPAPPGSVDWTISENSFVQCNGALAFRHASGDNRITFHNNIVTSSRSSVSYIPVGSQSGSLTVNSRDNLVKDSNFGCILTAVGASALRLDATFDGDRFINNSALGLLVATDRNTTGTVKLDNLMCCGSPSIGLTVSNPAGSVSIDASHLTIADNGTGIVGGAGQRFDHCILANNQTDYRPGPSFSYCCFQGSTAPGTGNLNRTDPVLMRPTYKLASTSPCIDAGATNGTFAATDYEGDPRASIGRANGTRRTDIGADEYVYAGSVRTYGPIGFGEFNFFPEISSPQQTIAIGQTLQVDLKGAIFPVFNVPATAAVLGIGERDDWGMLPPELSMYGARGTLILSDLLAFTPMVPVSQQGTATLNLRIPVDSKLVGKTITLQWVALLRRLNPLGAVTSNGLRVTFGR